MKTEISSSLYSLLPETTETQFVKELTGILSEVRMDGWMDGRTDEWMDGWTDGLMDGWMDGWTDR